MEWSPANPMRGGQDQGSGDASILKEMRRRPRGTAPLETDFWVGEIPPVSMGGFPHESGLESVGPIAAIFARISSKDEDLDYRKMPMDPEW